MARLAQLVFLRLRTSPIAAIAALMFSCTRLTMKRGRKPTTSRGEMNHETMEMFA